MNSFSTDNADVAYSDRGEGDPVFLVHAGVFSEWFLPVSQTRSLDTFRVVRVQRAGYAGPMPSRHLTMADHARHVAALADHLGLESVERGEWKSAKGDRVRYSRDAKAHSARIDG